MIYIITLIVCFYLVLKYDWCGNKKNKIRCYYGLMIWFIVVSGLQYYVGSDIEEYIYKYQSFNDSLGFNTFLERSGDRQQPGWVILTWFCKCITDNFLLMKIIQATFLNVAIFTFFRRESKYVFLCVFFYAVSDYLVLNFNTLRQSYAVAFGLYAISYLRREDYYKYGLFTILSFLFHSSALLLLVVPIFKFFKPTKTTIGIGVLLIAAGIYLLSHIDFESAAMGLFNSGVMGDSASTIAMGYLSDERLGARTGASLGSQALIVLTIVGYYLIKKRDFFWGGFGVAYFFFLILTTMMPALWRFRLYFDMPYFVMLAQIFIKFPIEHFRRVKQRRKIKYAFYVVALAIFMYFPMRDYFIQLPRDTYRYIDQYYPYHSILNPKMEKRF